MVFSCFVKAPIITDENGTMANAAFLSGLYDWSAAYNSSISMYWGYGYSILWIPVFYFIKDIFIVYRLLCIFNSIIISIIPYVIYRILKENFKTLSIKEICVISLLLGLLPVNFIFSKNTWNEPMLLLLQWLFVFLLLKANQSQKRYKYIYSAILGGLCAYSCTVHERGIVFFIAILIGSFFYYVIRKKVWVSAIPFLFSFLFGYKIHIIIKNIIINNLIKVDSSIARNTSESLFSKDLLVILNPENWGGFITGIFGQVYYIIYSSMGLVIIALMSIVYIIYKSICKHREIDKAKDCYVCLAIYSGLLFIGTLLISSIFYYKSYISDTARGLEYYLYGRYNESAVGILLLLAILSLLYVKRNKPAMSKPIIFISLCTMLLIGIISIFVLKRILNITDVVFNEANISFFIPFTRKGFLEKAKISDFIIINIAIFLLSFSFFLIFYYPQKMKIGIVFLVCLFLIIDLRYFQESVMVRNNKQYEQIAGLKDYLSSDSTLLDIENIYLTDVSTRTLTIQFLFPESNVTFLNTKTYGYEPLKDIKENSLIISGYDEEFDRWLSQFYLLDSVDGYFFWRYGDYNDQWGNLKGTRRNTDQKSLSINNAYLKENSNYSIVVNNYQSGAAVDYSEGCLATQTDIFLNNNGIVSFKNRNFLAHKYYLTFYGNHMDEVIVDFETHEDTDIKISEEWRNKTSYKICVTFDKEYKNVEIKLTSNKTDLPVSFQKLVIVNKE